MCVWVCKWSRSALYCVPTGLTGFSMWDQANVPLSQLTLQLFRAVLNSSTFVFLSLTFWSNFALSFWSWSCRRQRACQLRNSKHSPLDLLWYYVKYTQMPGYECNLYNNAPSSCATRLQPRRLPLDLLPYIEHKYTSAASCWTAQRGVHVSDRPSRPSSPQASPTCGPSAF